MKKIDAIKLLREQYNCGISLVKEAYDKFSGNVEAAGQWLKNNWRGHEFKAAKDGAIFFYGHPADNPQHVAMVELRCGTDFVAPTIEFEGAGG